MCQSFIALAARRDESRIAAGNRIVRVFWRARLKRPTPQHRFGILQIALDEQLLFVRGCGDVDNGHLAAQAQEDVVAGVDDASGGVENEFTLRVLFEIAEDLVESGDFFGKILGFAFGVGRTVGPAHPGGYAVDAGVSPRLENASEPGFDFVVAADGRAAVGGKVFRPMAFSSARHANQGEAQRSMRISRHNELKSLTCLS